MNRESSQQKPNTRMMALNPEKQECTNRIETQSYSNRNTTYPNTETNTYTRRKTLQTLKRVTSKNNTTLPSLRN